MKELEYRKNVTGQVLPYTRAIHWFVSVVVLSKQMHGQASSFPAKQLMDQYREKRHKTDSLQTSYGQPGLLVDILCRDIGEDLVNAFKRGGRPATYPDPTLQPLADCSAPAKHRLVQYFFLDLSHQLPHDTWHQTQSGLLAFWLLDHEDWEEAVTMMLDPLIQEDELTVSLHRAILVVLLTQKQHSLALRSTRLRRPPVTDPR